MKKEILIIVFVCFTSVLSSQVYEVGVFLGGSNFIGDIGSTKYIYPNEPAGALFFKFNKNPRIAYRATYSFLPIKGNDLEADTDFKKNRGLRFSNTIHELAVGIEYNFYEYDLSTPGKTWTPYITLDLAAYNYNYITSEPRPDQYEYDTKNAFTVPFGIGFKSKLIGNFAFAVETKFRYSFSDDLDYTTETIPDLNFGGTSNDWYTFTGISLIYTFGRPPCYTTGF
ncbi:type IX secretion system protein PorG [Polaribacter sp. M15]